MKKIDVTGKQFDFVDCSEGNIFFNSFSEGEKFEIKIWGATLLQELDAVEQDSYIAGMSGLVFEDVVYIVMQYGIYADEQGTKFIYDVAGKSTDMQLELGKRQMAANCKEYILGGILGRYVGYAEIRIYCRGKITLTFDENMLIDAADFCLNPKKYRFH